MQLQPGLFSDSGAGSLNEETCCYLTRPQSGLPCAQPRAVSGAAEQGL